MEWAINWFLGLLMLGLTVGFVYGVITAGWWVYHYVEYLESKRTDDEQRLHDQREYDRKMLALQFDQQKKMMLDSGLIDPTPVETDKTIGRKIKS